jgi:Protein of unknown function (DUF3108)
MNEWIKRNIYPKPGYRTRSIFIVQLLAVVALIVVITPINVLALNIPEKLTYDLTWTGIKGGTATQEIIDEGASVRVVSTARSSDWISVFFPVEDRIESILNKVAPPLIGLPQHYQMKVSEGSHKRDKELTFDHKIGKAYYIDHRNGEKATIDILPNTYDAYSSFYYLRSLNLEVGKSVFVSMLDNKKLWNVEVQVVKKEKLNTILGEVNTIQVRPIMKSEGIFDRKGAIDIWLTDDERRIPVKMKTKIKIGSITATLVKVN